MDRTKQAICEAFSQLLEEKPISKISVREIAAQCGVARNTFYYHYRDIPTLLQQILEEVMDEDKVDEIYDYFLTSTSDSINEALDEFDGEDISEEEIRLVRIKFLSENAN